VLAIASLSCRPRVLPLCRNGLPVYVHIIAVFRHNMYGQLASTTCQVFNEMASIMDTTWPFLLTKIIILIFPILYKTVTIQIFKYTCVLVYMNFGK